MLDLRETESERERVVKRAANSKGMLIVCPLFRTLELYIVEHIKANTPANRPFSRRRGGMAMVHIIFMGLEKEK